MRAPGEQAARPPSCALGVLPHAGSPHQARSRLCLERPSADSRRAGREGGRGLADPARHFWAKTRGNFSPRSMSSGARPDALTPEGGILENRACLPSRRGGASGAWGPVVCPARSLSAGPCWTPPPGCPGFQIAFLSLWTMPPGDAGLAQEGGALLPQGPGRPLTGPALELVPEARRPAEALRDREGA